MLGLSLTSTSVGWVLLDGQGSDAVTLDDDAFDVQPGTDGDAGETPPHAAAARGAHAIAMASGHKVGHVHVTWTDGVEEEAAALLKSLADLGFDDVHAIPLTRAARAWGIEAGIASEHSKLALCVLEPGAATIMVVATGAGTVRTAVADTRETPDDLVEWLRTVFRKDGWLPESLYLVGALADLDEVTEPIADALPIPVTRSVDTQLALARGAALASADSAQAVDGPRERVSVPRKSTKPDGDTPTTHADAETVVVPVINHAVASGTEPTRLDSTRHDRPWLLAHAKKLTISAAGIVVLGAGLSLAAGSALNVENASLQAAQESDSGASATTASVHTVPAPPPVRPAPPVQPLAAEPPAVPPPPPETLVPPAEPAVVATPEPMAAPVPHQTAAAPAPVAVPVVAPVSPPPAAPLAAPVAAPAPAAPAVVAPPPLAPFAAPAPAAPAPAPVAPPPLAPFAAPAPAAPAAIAPPPAAPALIPPPPAAPAPVPPPPGAPVAPPAPADAPPPDPIQAALSPLFSGLP